MYRQGCTVVGHSIRETGLLINHGHRCSHLPALSDQIAFIRAQVRAAMEKYPPYQSIFSKLQFGESQILDKAFYEAEVKACVLAYEQQVRSGPFANRLV